MHSFAARLLAWTVALGVATALNVAPLAAQSAGPADTLAEPIPAVAAPQAVFDGRGTSFVINLRDAELQTFAEQVSDITGRTLVLDPKVKGKVTIISNEPLAPDAIWALFQSVLRVQGFAAVKSGALWRIVPQAEASRGASTEVAGLGEQDIVTRIIPLAQVPAEAAAAALKPLIANFGTLQALRKPNALVVTDSSETVRRIETLANELDRGQAGEVATFSLVNGSATAVAQSIATLLSPEATGAAAAPSVAVDTRSNTLLVRGTAETLAEIRGLIRVLDRTQPDTFTTVAVRHAEVESIAAALTALTAPTGNDALASAPRISIDRATNTLLLRGDPGRIAEVRGLVRRLDRPGAQVSPSITRVVRLKFGDAEVVAEILRGLVGAEPPARNPVARALRRETPAQQAPAPDTAPIREASLSTATDTASPASGGQASARRRADQRLDGSNDMTVSGAGNSVAIQASSDLNAIVLRGPRTGVEEAAALIAELDQRRPQVLIEAAIVEISGDAAEQLGIQFGAGDGAPEGGVLATSFTNAGTSLSTILAILGVPAAPIIGPGLTASISIGDEFGILLQALAQSTSANLLSTPSITTLDNAPAEIVVGQNVPFRTGSFTLDGNGQDPFTTIEREDVGLTLRVDPRVLEGGVVRLVVEQEVSSLVNATVAGAADLITNRRSIETTVLADNGETIVLGGLISDDQIDTESKVPVLGDIPIAGELFRSSSESRTKRTLFVFLRPTILRTRGDAATTTAKRIGRIGAASPSPLEEKSPLFEPPSGKIKLELGGIY